MGSSNLFRIFNKFSLFKNFTQIQFQRTFSNSKFLYSRKKDDDDEYVEVQPPPQEHPFKRTMKIFKHDFKSAVDPNLPPLLEMPKEADVVIIGGGIMGCAIAYAIKSRLPKKALEIIVIEKDPSYTRSSTVLSVGGLRQQFSLKENIQMSLYSAEFLRKVPQKLHIEDNLPPDIQFHPHGYLFLATKAGADTLLENYALQKELGAKVAILTKDKLKETYPWLNVEDIEFGSLGLENEGWFDPWALLYNYKRKAMSLGVEFIKGEVVGFEFQTNEVIQIAGQDANEPYVPIEKALVKSPNGNICSIKFARCVLAAGHESGKIAEMARLGRGEGILSVPLPVEPRKRYVYCYHAPQGPGLDCPLVIDPSGAYFRREGMANFFIGGQSPPISDEPNVENLDVDYSYFDNTVWPNLAHRVPAFENIKVKSAWAGYYDYNSFDQNAIIGQHNYHLNLYFATGFSGHGIQQAPAVGRAISELILDGSYRTIDLNRFSFERLIVGEEVLEKNCV